MQIVKVMNGIVYDQGMIYLTNIQRMRYGYHLERRAVFLLRRIPHLLVLGKNFVLVGKN